MFLTVNGQPTEIANDATVADALAHLGLENRPCAVELNENVVPKRDHTTVQLNDGDNLELVTLVGGG